MRLYSIKGLASTTVLAASFLYITLASPSFGDEPGFIGRLFRQGGGTTPSQPLSAPGVTTPSSGVTRSYAAPALSTPPSSLPGQPVGPKLTPKSRVVKAVTEADPLVTRIQLIRSTDGSQFGEFLQVYADGTVIDSSGVHKVGADVLKPVVEAVASGDLAKLKGHCGGPAGDYIETVQMVVYERSLGRLKATAFSFSGNPQGCDHAVIHLNKVLENLQARITPAATAVITSPPAGASPAPELHLSNP